jgi:hypothetical protein
MSRKRKIQACANGVPNGIGSLLIVYHYNSRDQLDSIRQTGPAVADKVVAFTYDSQNRLQQLNRYADAAKTRPASDSTFGYDPATRRGGDDRHVGVCAKPRACAIMELP